MVEEGYVYLVGSEILVGSVNVDMNGTRASRPCFTA